MPTVINSKYTGEKRGALTSALANILPYKLYGEIVGRLSGMGRIEEIRCRKDRPTFVTCGGQNIRLSYICGAEDMEQMILRICGGSLYAHKETLLEGYVTLSGGIRVGVCGRASSENGRMLGIYDVSGLNFRLPAALHGIGAPVCRLLRQGGGVLVYSAPGEGKTTLLRAVAEGMSTGAEPWRVCVVDTRGELSMADGGIGETADVLLYYPKDKGIEIATRTMNPQLIVCDEIGGAAEAEAIISAENCGVPLLAAAHAPSISALLRRTGLRRLHEASVFSHYVGISRNMKSGELDHRITAWEDANALL